MNSKMILTALVALAMTAVWTVYRIAGETLQKLAKR